MVEDKRAPPLSFQRAMELYRAGSELDHTPCKFKFEDLHKVLGDTVISAIF